MRIVFKRIYNNLISDNLISKNQSGFRTSDSAVIRLLYLTHEIQEAFDNKRYLEICNVYLDVTKASDKVWHEGPHEMIRNNFY